MSANNNDFEREVNNFRTTLVSDINRFANLYTLNRNWDIALTISAIAFTFLAGFPVVFNSSKILSEDAKNIATGIFGLISAAVQTASSQFPVRARAKISEQQRNKLSSLKLRTINNPDELEAAKLDYAKIVEIEIY